MSYTKFSWYLSIHISTQGPILCYFYLILNISSIKGWFFLGWTSTKLGLMFLLKHTTQWCWWCSNPRLLGLESSTLTLSHYAPTPYFVCNPTCSYTLIMKFISMCPDFRTNSTSEKDLPYRKCVRCLHFRRRYERAETCHPHQDQGQEMELSEI